LKYNSDIIEEYEKEFKKGIDELSKKTNILDRLNNKLEVFNRSNNSEGDNNQKGDGGSNPLEHTIHHLSKELKSSQEKCDELQKKWIVKQTELVNLVNDTMKQEEFVNNLNCRETILSQKKIRLQNECKMIQNEISAINKSINGLRLDITKLNKHINEYNSRSDALCVEYENIERKYQIDLELGEEKAVAMKGKIDKINEEKRKTIEEITNCEKQILLWERKIRLEMETQKALDPNYGKKEVEDMKKEIHRMEMRLNQLKRKQDDIIKEMELSINKKESIQLRNLGKNAAAKANGTNSLSLNKKQISAIKSNIKNGLKEKKLIVQQIEDYTNKYNEMLNQLDITTERLNQLNNEKNMLKDNILNKSILQKAYLNHIVSKQKTIKDATKIIEQNNDDNNAENKGDIINKKYERQLLKLNELKEKIISISKEHPQFESVFNIITADDIDSHYDQILNQQDNQENVV